MKLGKRHLQLVLALVALSVLYNIWVFFFRPSGTARPTETPLLSTVQRPMRPGMTNPALPAGAPQGAAANVAVDPASIPAPPAFDPATAPAWLRDPMLAPGESRDVRPVERAAVVEMPTDVVISSILYSSTRRSAMVDRRVVGIGDPVGGGVITDIQPNAIVVRMPSGAQRRIEMVRSFGAEGVTSGAARSK